MKTCRTGQLNKSVFFQVFVDASRLTFARIIEIKWQIIVRLMMVFWFNKMDCKKQNWVEQIVMERWKLSHKSKEFQKATCKQRTGNLIFAGLYIVKQNENVLSLSYQVSSQFKRTRGVHCMHVHFLGGIVFNGCCLFYGFSPSPSLSHNFRSVLFLLCCILSL